MYLLQEFTVLYLIPAQDVYGPQDNPTPAPLLPYDQVKMSGRKSTRKVGAPGQRVPNIPAPHSPSISGRLTS